MADKSAHEPEEDKKERDGSDLAMKGERDLVHVVRPVVMHPRVYSIDFFGSICQDAIDRAGGPEAWERCKDPSETRLIWSPSGIQPLDARTISCCSDKGDHDPFTTDEDRIFHS